MIGIGAHASWCERRREEGYLNDYDYGDHGSADWSEDELKKKLTVSGVERSKY